MNLTGKDTPYVSEGYLKYRRGIRDHWKKGIITGDEYFMHFHLCMEADYNSGIVWNTSAPFLASPINWTAKRMKAALKGLEDKKYIKRFYRNGNPRFPYNILIDKYEIAKGPRVVLEKTLSLNKIEYESVQKESRKGPEKGPETVPEKDPEKGLNNKKKEIKKKEISVVPEYLEHSHYLKSKIIEITPTAKITASQLDNWANEFRLMIERDGRTVDFILDTIDRTFEDGFWSLQIRSMAKLRQKINEGKLPPQTKLESSLEPWRDLV